MYDILGIRDLSQDQMELVEAMHSSNRVVAPAANAVGKSFSVAAYGVYFIDAEGSELDEEGVEKGALWILTAPSASLIFSVLWGTALRHIRNAERRGYMMPGNYSELSVRWRVREDWQVEAISPPKSAGETQQHGASGRHAEKLLITIDEAPGVERARYRSAEGMASGDTNKIVLVGNPTEAIGPFVEATHSAQWQTVRISAMNHPNVTERREVIGGGAISHRKTDKRVFEWCEDRGPYIPDGNIQPDPKFHDFVYALHPWVKDPVKARDIPDPSPRDDNFPGHADAPLHIFRPNGAFLPTVMGIEPAQGTGGLFDPALVRKAQERWVSYYAPDGPYSRIGVDPAEEGGDEIIAAPLWDLGNGRYRVDRLLGLRKGLDDAIANQLFQHFGNGPKFVVDAIGTGSGVARRMETDHYANVERFKGSEAEWHLTEEGEPPFFNLRAAAYWRAAQMVKKGEVDLPPDPLLLEELIAMTYEFRTGKLLIIPKKELRKADNLGRSPDRADAVVMALHNRQLEEEAGAISVAVGGRASDRYKPVGFSFYSQRGL